VGVRVEMEKNKNKYRRLGWIERHKKHKKKTAPI